MLFLDVQGTLISDADKSLIDGACELVAWLNVRQIPYVIITNNTKDLNFLQNLRQKGLEIKDGAYLDPFFVLKERLKPCKIAAYGASEFKAALCELGFTLDYAAPKALLVASWDAFSFDEFAQMIELAAAGVPLVAMHETSIYKKNGRSYPGVGAIMQMLKYATNADYAVFGKPSVAFYETALKMINLQISGENSRNLEINSQNSVKNSLNLAQNSRPAKSVNFSKNSANLAENSLNLSQNSHSTKSVNFSDILIISDDFKGDLLKARELGMKIVLVLSGKLNSAKGLTLRAGDRVFASVKEFLAEIKKA